MSFNKKVQPLTGAGTGNVNGPVSSTDTAVAVFNGTDGTAIQSTAIKIAGAAVSSSSAISIASSAGITLDSSGASQPVTLKSLGNGDGYLLVTDSTGISASGTFGVDVAIDTNNTNEHYVAFRNTNGEAWAGTASDGTVNLGTTGAANLVLSTQLTPCITIDGTTGSVTIANALILSTAIASAVADIASPGTATAADCANKINALLAALRAANLIAT